MEGSSSEEILDGGDAAAGSGTVGEDAISDGKEREREERGEEDRDSGGNCASRVVLTLAYTSFFLYMFMVMVYFYDRTGERMYIRGVKIEALANKTERYAADTRIL